MPFRVWTDGLVSIRVANLTVIVSSKRRRVSVACISYGNTAQLSGEQSGKTLQRSFHYACVFHAVSGLICSPQSLDVSKLQGIPRLAADLQREIHTAFTGKDCNPQPANCLKDQYVLRHCCVDDRSGKIGSFRKSSCFNKIQHGNKFIIPLLTLL